MNTMILLGWGPSRVQALWSRNCNIEIDGDVDVDGSDVDQWVQRQQDDWVWWSLKDTANGFGVLTVQNNNEWPVLINFCFHKTNEEDKIEVKERRQKIEDRKYKKEDNRSSIQDRR